MSAIDMPDCPECGEDLTMDFGNVDFDDGLVHHFDCNNCGNHEAWGMEEMKNRGVERPSISDFIEHYDLTISDLRETMTTTELQTFLRSFNTSLDELRGKITNNDEKDEHTEE